MSTNTDYCKCDKCVCIKVYSSQGIRLMCVILRWTRCTYFGGKKGHSQHHCWFRLIYNFWFNIYLLSYTQKLRLTVADSQLDTRAMYSTRIGKEEKKSVQWFCFAEVCCNIVHKNVSSPSPIIIIIVIIIIIKTTTASYTILFGNFENSIIQPVSWVSCYFAMSPNLC